MTAGKIKIIFLGIFREITKESEISVYISEKSTVGSIIKKIRKKYGKDFNKIIDQVSGNISNEFLIILNGQGIRTPNTLLKDKDVLMFTVPLGGG